MGIAALILGVLSVLFSFFSAFGLTWCAIVTGAVGTVMGVLARKTGPDAMGTAGLVLSVVGASLGVVFLVAFVAVVAWLGSIFGSIV